MNTKKIIAVTLSAIICSAVITPVASADDIGKKAAEEAIKHRKKYGDKYTVSTGQKAKLVEYDCTKVTATDEKGNSYGTGTKESNNKKVREMAKQNGWKIKEYKGKCLKSVKIN